MRWLDLAFIHCRIDASILERALPSGLALDRYEGEAWLGLVPFRMASVAPRGLPAFPRFSTFPEINVRTYVIADGKPGVWFFSLDADSAPTVFAGRTFLDLPYHLAGIQLTRDADALRFNSVRRRGDAHFRGSYRPVGEVFHATLGSFEHWAAERYCLYSHSPGRGLARVEVHHPPWPLQRAEVDIDENSLFAAAGLAVPNEAPRCHFSPGVDVLSFNPVRLAP